MIHHHSGAHEYAFYYLIFLLLYFGSRVQTITLHFTPVFTLLFLYFEYKRALCRSPFPIVFLSLFLSLSLSSTHTLSLSLSHTNTHTFNTLYLSVIPCCALVPSICPVLSLWRHPWSFGGNTIKQILY